MFSRILRVQNAFHTPLVADCRDAFLDSVRGIVPSGGMRPPGDGSDAGSGEPLFYSTVRACAWDETMPSIDAQYLWDNIEQPVLFADTVRCVVNDMYDSFHMQPLMVELGPQPALAGNLKQCGVPPEFCLCVQRRGEPEQHSVMHLVAQLSRMGLHRTLRMQSVFGTCDAVRNDAAKPATYPFQRARIYQMNEFGSEQTRPVAYGPMAGAQVFSRNVVFRQMTSLLTHPWLAGHCIGETPIYPAAGYAESMLEVVRALSSPLSLTAD